jgi:hypothetical protein
LVDGCFVWNEYLDRRDQGAGGGAVTASDRRGAAATPPAQPLVSPKGNNKEECHRKK